MRRKALRLRSRATAQTAAPQVLFSGLAAYGAHGGIQRFNRRVINALSGLGVPTKVLMLVDRPEDIQASSWTLPISGFSGDRLRFSRSFAKAALGADILLLGHINLLPFALLYKILRPNGRVVLFAHGIEVWGDPAYRQPKRWEPWALRRAIDRVAVVSAYSRDRMAASFELPVDKFVQFPNAVDLTPVRPETKDASVILCVSRLSASEREKHVDKVIQALPTVLTAVPDARLKIIGDGQLKGELQALAVELGVSDQVALMGSVSDDDLAQAYATATLFVLPSSKEGFGIVYLEAWVRGLPVIGSIHGAAGEVIDEGVDGRLVEPTDIAALSNAMTELLSDPRRAAALAAAGRAKVSAHYSGEAFSSNLKKLLSSF